MIRRRRLVSGLAAVAAASLASGQSPARPYRTATISRERPDRIVICPLPRRGVLIAAGTAMPLHHPPSTVGRARAAQRCWAGGIEAQETVARRRHAPGHEPAGVHAAVVCASVAAEAAPDQVPWGAGAEREAAAAGGAARDARASAGGHGGYAPQPAYRDTLVLTYRAGGL